MIVMQMVTMVTTNESFSACLSCLCHILSVLPVPSAAQTNSMTGVSEADDVCVACPSIAESLQIVAPASDTWTYTVCVCVRACVCVCVQGNSLATARAEEPCEDSLD